jgi:CheY-like chemotaxis protein
MNRADDFFAFLALEQRRSSVSRVISRVAFLGSPYANSIFIMKRLRVLVADDNDATRSAMVELLCKHFQLVGVVCDGEELVQSAACLLPDVVITDILMPRVDGLTARSKLIALNRAGPFVFVSALGKEAVRYPLNDPPVALVYKADVSSHLISAIAAVITGCPYLSPYYRE